MAEKEIREVADKRLSPSHKLLVALAVALFLYAGQIGSWMGEVNRYHGFWELTDCLAIMLGVGALTIVGALAAIAIDTTGSVRLRRVGHGIFLLALSAGVLASLNRAAGHVDHRLEYDPLCTIVWLGVIATLWRWRVRLVRPAVAFCLVMSPLAPILFLQMLLWPSWQNETPRRSHGVSLTAERKGDPACPVYLFVFDEWSYLRSIDKNGVSPELPNLCALAAQSIVFSEARAPGHCTTISLPRLLFQQNGVLSPHRGRPNWTHAGQTLPAQQVPSLFSLARRHGYRTAMIGFYLPYTSILGEHLDFCCAYPHEPKADSLAGRALELGAYNIHFLTDPLSRTAWRAAYREHYSRHWYALNQWVRTDAEQIIEGWPNNTFAFMHWPLPHAPFIFNEDGSYRGAFPGERMFGTAEDYYRQLKCLDLVVGNVVDRLKETDKFDRAMIIVTSDHSWHLEPDEALRDESDEDRRVPLLIKLPGQAESELCHDRFVTTELQPLIESVLASRGDREQAARLVKSMLRIAPVESPVAATPRPILDPARR